MQASPSAYRSRRSPRAAACAALVAATAASTAVAEVYRCQVGGRTVYTDTPCSADATPAALPPLGATQAPPPALPKADAQAAAAAKQHRAADEAWLKAYQARKRQAEAVRRGVVEDRVVPGMSRDQVERILNLPAATETQGEGRERWIYKDGKKRRVITFDHGQVVTDSLQPRHKEK